MFLVLISCQLRLILLKIQYERKLLLNWNSIRVRLKGMLGSAKDAAGAEIKALCRRRLGRHWQRHGAHIDLEFVDASSHLRSPLH